jgi:pyridoxal 5'-phosphate synthase pdxS subunit
LKREFFGTQYPLIQTRVRHARAIQAEIKRASVMTDEELYAYAKEISAPYHLLKETARLKRLPVVNFAAGGIATPGEFFALFRPP